MSQSCIYILQDGNDLGTHIYKIGKTNDITTRLILDIPKIVYYMKNILLLKNNLII